jgi:hypothetical protein
MAPFSSSFNRGIFTTLTALLAVIGTPVFANTLVFFAGTACNYNLANVQCGTENPGDCCLTGAPFCQRFRCGDCAQGNDLYGFNRASCTGGAAATCREPGNGAYCCLTLANGKTCAGSWEIGGAKKRTIGAMAETIETGNITAVADNKDCKRAFEVNKMVYIDDKGVTHEIHMPKGTFKQAAEYLVAENWAELAKYPAWSQYSPFEKLESIH